MTIEDNNKKITDCVFMIGIIFEYIPEVDDKLNENYLIIHIRSGDIFRKNPHSNYVPPPLSYYMNQINIKNSETT